MSARSVILLAIVLCMLHDLSLVGHHIEAKRFGGLAGENGNFFASHELRSNARRPDDIQFAKYFDQPMPNSEKSISQQHSNFVDISAKAQSNVKTSQGHAEQQQQQHEASKQSSHINENAYPMERVKRQHNHIQLTQNQQQQQSEFPELTQNFDQNSRENVNDSQHSTCFYTYRARNGIIHTPNFPRKFQTPIECVWVIDTSELPTSGSANRSIFIYLTQLYVLGGLKFTEYMYYSDDYKVPSHRAFTLNEDDVTQVAWVQFTSQYLEIRFTMATLDGTHLRALDRLLDVYGFNITYEVHDKVKAFQCNTLQCRFLGHCYAERDFRSYYCSCFAGFSGSDCGHGPLCDDPHTNVCRNGGICKHIGDAAITCHCPAGYKGTKCEIPDINEKALGCMSKYPANDCQKQCQVGKYLNASTSLKSGKNAGRNGKTRYEVTIRLGENLTNFYRNSDKERRPGDHLPSLLERHLMRALRNFNITKVSDLELISNSSDRLDITFHFFGIKGDSNRIREAITRMVERGRIGNITLVSNYHLFDENPPLNLLEMTISPNSSIRENNEFIISCTAQGSSRMQFQWFKDGAIVNTTKSIRQIWSSVLPPESRNTLTAVLGIKKAKALDEGIYTCMVTDWDVEQCLSLHVHIKVPPRLRVDPASVTLHRGDSLRVRCLSPGNDDIKRYAQLGYSWTRNGVLFQSDPATAMWEDLYPDGSILKINNIQKSAEYSCVVSNSVKPVFKSVYITVIDRNSVHVCHTETLFQVRWPTSAPGAPIITECPKGYQGHARRVCEQRDADNSKWLQPDFATCVQDQLLEIYNVFLGLAAGYQQTDVAAIIKDIFHFTMRTYKTCLPGEAGFVIDMLQEIDSYLQVKGTQFEREMAMEIILHILDKIMQNPNSLNNQQQIKKLQLLTQSVALNRETIAASQLAISTGFDGHPHQHQRQSPPYSTSLQSSLSSVTEAVASSSSSILTGASSTIGVSRQQPQQQQQQQFSTATLLRSDDVVGDTGAIFTAPDGNSLSLDSLNSLRIYMTSVKSLPFNLRIYGDDLFTDKLYMEIALSSHLLSIMANSTLFASVISYKNLNSFLPKTYFTRGNDPRGSDYILASRIIQTWLFQSNRSNDYRREPLDLPVEFGHVEIIFQHENAQQNADWVPICGCEHKAPFESNWRTDLCITKNLMANLTRCVCPISGTYVVLLTKRHANETVAARQQGPMFVIIGCGSCFLQAFLAFLVLFPIWYSRKCAITFLKMQFCFSTTSNMVIYLLGFLKMLPENWHPIVSSSLASLMLLGVSTLIAIALVIHTDLMSRKLYHDTKPVAISATTAITATTTTPPTTAGTINTMKSHKTKLDNKSIKATPQQTITTTTTSPHGSPPPTALHETQIINNNSNSNSNRSLNSSADSTTGNKTLRCSAMAMAVTMTTKTGPRSGSASKYRGCRPTLPTARVTARNRNSAVDYNVDSVAGIKAAIGISWLLPLLFAISSPLICNIIGKWPQHWWLETSTSFAARFLSSDRSGDDYLPPTNGATTNRDNRREPLLHNGDNVALVPDDDNVEDDAATARTYAAGAAAMATERATTANTFDSAAQSSSSSLSWPIYQHNRDEHVARSSHTSYAYLSSSPYDTNASYYDETETPHDDEEGNEATSLNFIIFICVYILFISLFCALFVILIKKLLWLSRKNHRGNEQHTLPHDKNNVAPMRSLGLLYRSGYLLIMKLSTDALFVAYVNRSAVDSQLCYPFGISCILLGFTVVYSFVLRSEAASTASSASASSSSAASPTTKADIKRKHDTTKISLSENFGAGSLIGSPSLNFYASHEKEPPTDSSLLVRIPPPPQQIEMSTNMQMPLAAAHYQMLVKPSNSNNATTTITSDVDISRHGHHRNDGHHSVIIESCLVSTNKVQPSTVMGMRDNLQQQQQLQRNLDNSPGIGCCNILNTNINGNSGGGTYSASMGSRPQTIQEAYGYTSTYEPSYGGGQITLQQQQQHGLIGVDKLDILEGVTTDSTIIGIRPANQQFNLTYNQSHYDHALRAATASNSGTRICRNSPNVDTNTTSTGMSTTTTTTAIATAATTTSVTTQTPKVQKRVTITEPTTHTFDPMLPTMIVVAAAAAATADSVASNTKAYLPQCIVAPAPTPSATTPPPPTPPTITITCSPLEDSAAVVEPKARTPKSSDETPTTDDESSSLSGMLDRITHDLDYLLNRTTDSPTDDSMGYPGGVGVDAPHAGVEQESVVHAAGNL